jgi:hypothetical protein
MKKTLVFLDVDGVLHPVSTGSNFCCAPLFNTAIQNYAVDIILISDWRIGYGLPEIQELFSKAGIPIMDVTPDLSSLKPKVKHIREAEIELWRSLHDPYTPFIVLDDNPKLFSGAYRKKHVILTNKDIGFSENNLQKMIAKLPEITVEKTHTRLIKNK